jgi:hypothetical protein
MRLVTGTGADDEVTATSAPVAVRPGIVYTTTANLRFGWTNDPNPGAPATSRPNVSLRLMYLQASGAPSTVRAVDSFAWHQEDATTGFATFAVRYGPPRDAASVAVQVAASRHGLPTPITLDVDSVR